MCTSETRIGIKAALLALLLCFFWGGVTPAIKLSLLGMPPIAVAGWRFLIGLAVIWTWCLMTGAPWALPKRYWHLLLGFSAVFVVQISAINLGTELTSSSYAIVLLSTSPLFVSIMAHRLLPGDRLTSKKLLGLSLAFLGIVTIFYPTLGSEGYFWGNAFALAAGFLLAVLQVFGKFLASKVEATVIVFWEFAFGVPLFFFSSWLLESSASRDITPVVILSLLYQGVVVAGFCFVTWMYLLKQYPASRLSSFQFSIPIFGILLSWGILGESPSLELAVGTLLVAAGIYVVSTSNSTPQPAI